MKNPQTGPAEHAQFFAGVLHQVSPQTVSSVLKKMKTPITHKT